MERQEYESSIEWDKAGKFAKLYRTDKGMLIGDVGKGFKLVVSKNTASWAKENEYQAQLVPVKYTKKAAVNNQPLPPVGGSSEEVPF